jgi:hypothetical protein
VAAAGDLRLQFRFDGHRPQPVQTGDLGLGEGLSGHIGQRRTPPQLKCPADLFNCSGGVAGPERRTGVLGQPFEADAVEVGGLHLECVALAAGDDHARPQGLAELGDVVLEDAETGGGRAAGPEVFDQPVPGDDAAVVDEQVQEQRPLLGAARFDGLAVPQNLHGPEDPELHGDEA